MQPAEVVLSVLRERGRKGLPCTQLYRLDNKGLRQDVMPLVALSYAFGGR